MKAPSALAVAAVLFLIFGTAFWETFRDWLITNESGSTTIRNLGLVTAGLIALPLAIWRGLVAEKQAEAAQQSLRNERYQKGAEMLGSEVLSVRLGGIYALQRLAEEYPEEYHVQILQLFCAFIRHPTKDVLYECSVVSQTGHVQMREEIRHLIRAIAQRESKYIEIERQAKFRLKLNQVKLEYEVLLDANLSMAILTQSNLSEASLQGADLSSADLAGAILTGAKLQRANLSQTQLWAADMSNARLRGAKLSRAIMSGTNLMDANLSSADLTGVTGIDQLQLNEARADPNSPPILKEALDAVTGEQLEWQGKPLDDD